MSSVFELGTPKQGSAEALAAAVREAEWGSGPVVSLALLEPLGLLASMASFPVGVTIALVGIVGGVLESKLAASKERMPDEWLGQVAEATSVSQEGLAFLAKRLASAGFVSVQDALDWLVFEEAHAKALASRQAVQEPGAAALLKRAKAECGVMLEEPSMIDVAVSTLGSAVSAAATALKVAEWSKRKAPKV